MAPRPVLFCSHVVDWGGAERVLVDLLPALDRSRFTPHLACPGDGPLPARARELGVPLHTIPIGGTSPWRKAWSVPGAARAIRSLAKRIGAPLVVATSMIAGYAAVLAQHRELRCLWHLHIVPRSRLARHALRRAAIVVTPSRAGAVAVDPALAASTRLAVVPNGLPERYFAAPGTDLRPRLGLDASTPLVGIVGRIDPDKGHVVLLHALSALRVDGPAPHLVVAGGEAFAATRRSVRGLTGQIEAVAAELGLTSRAHFLGHVEDIAPLHGQLDVVVVPSTEPESAPRTIAEAQAAGRAVVASAIGGIPEMIEHDVTGLLVPPNDVAALQQALGRVLKNPAHRRRLGEAARAHALATLSVTAFARRFEGACDRALAANARPASD